MSKETEQLPEEVQTINIPVEMYVDMKIQIDRYKAGRPIMLPASLTTSEYNIMVNYLTEQRKAILNSDPKIPKPLKAEKNG